MAFSLATPAVTVTESALVHTRTAAMQAYGGTISADNVFVGDTLSDADSFGEVGAAQSSGTLRLERVAATHNFQGALTETSGELDIEDSVIGDLLDPTYGVSVSADTASTASLTKSAFVDAALFSIDVTEAAVDCDHILVADLTTAGIDADPGPLTIESSVIARVKGAGLIAYHGVTVKGLTVEDITYAPSMGLGVAMTFAGSTPIDLSDVYVRGASDMGIFVQKNSKPGAASTFKLSHALIENTTGRANGGWGVGIGLGSPSFTSTITDTLITGSHGAGILLTDAKASISRTVVEGVDSGTIDLLGNPLSAGKKTTAADGLLFHGGSGDHGVILTDFWVEGAQRSGITLSTEAHQLTRVRSSGGQVSLDLQDGATVTTDTVNLTGSPMEQVDPGTPTVPPSP